MWDLFMTFAKIGMFTFGGGYAMIVLIEDECVAKRKWLSHDEMLNITVIAESTPGPIAINCATYVGYKQAGFKGSVAATLGIVMPSFLIIYLISLCYDAFLGFSLVSKAFQGIKVAVGLLIVNAALGMIKRMPKRLLPRSLMALSCLVMLYANAFAISLSSIWVMLSAGALTLCGYIIRHRRSPAVKQEDQENI